jgi:hypothetical protein
MVAKAEAAMIGVKETTVDVVSRKSLGLIAGNLAITCDYRF